MAIRMTANANALAFAECQRANALLFFGVAPPKRSLWPFTFDAPDLPGLRATQARRLGGFPAQTIKVGKNEIVIPPLDAYWLPENGGGYQIAAAIEVQCDGQGTPTQIEAARASLRRLAVKLAVFGLRRASQKRASVVFVGWTSVSPSGRRVRSLERVDVTAEEVASSEAWFDTAAEDLFKRVESKARHDVAVAVGIGPVKGATATDRVVAVVKSAAALPFNTRSCAVCPFASFCSSAPKKLAKITAADLDGYTLKTASGCVKRRH